ISNAVKKIDKKNIEKYSFVLRKEINLLAQSDCKKYKRIINRHHFLRDFKNGLRSRKHFYTFLYNRLLFKLKKREDFFVFESFQGRSYSDNPKYIYEYIMENHGNCHVVWIVNEKENIPGNPK